MNISVEPQSMLVNLDHNFIGYHSEVYEIMHYVREMHNSVFLERLKETVAEFCINLVTDNNILWQSPLDALFPIEITLGLGSPTTTQNTVE